VTSESPLAARLAASSGKVRQWSSVAAGWERRRSYVWEISQGVGSRLVELLDPQPGATVLELAAGPGVTGFVAAERIGSSGRLISTDVAPEMVAVAEHRGSELGLANVEYRVVDAEAIGLPDGSVDGVLCRWGYMLMPDPARALRETRRVLAPGGGVAFAVWAEADVNLWGSSIGRALLELGLIERPPPDAPGPFRLGDAGRVRELVSDAGLEALQLEDLPITWSHESFDDYWDVTADLSFLLTAALETLDAGELDEVRRRTAAALAPFTQPDGALAIPGLCRVGLARRPG